MIHSHKNLVSIWIPLAIFLGVQYLNLHGQNLHGDTPEAEDRELRIVFVGDVMLDGGPGHKVASGSDPFAKCEAILKRADLRVANLECVLGRKGSQQRKPYTFRAATDSPRFLAKHFDVVGLANSRFWNRGFD
jgi:hypothetical protein